MKTNLLKPASDTSANAAHPVEAESINGAALLPDPIIKQAKKDLDSGLVDTDMRATAGLDARQRAKLVPGVGGKPLK